MTVVSDLGMRRSVAGRIECQSNVPTETMIITATSAAIGMIAGRGEGPSRRESYRSGRAAAARGVAFGFRRTAGWSSTRAEMC
jgi:hypothetical protein